MTDEPRVAAVTRAAERHSASGLWHAVLLVCRALAACYERWLQRQDLAELDDHLLRDIGISPHDVARECAKPFWRR